MLKMFQGHFLHLPASRNMPFLVSFSVLLHPKSLMLALDFSFKSQKNVNHLSTYWLILLHKHFPCLFSSVHSLSRVRLFATPWITAHQASLSITNSQGLLKLMSIESVTPSNPLILCRPLLLLPPIPPSIRVFSSESTLLMRWPKY